MQLVEEYGTYKGKRFRYLHSKVRSEKGILLMHGYSFYAEVWQECGLTDALEDMGYYIISIDVPGFPKSKSTFSLGEGEFADFLDTAIKSMFSSKPVLLGSSASGYLALDYASKSDRIRAVIAVAPVNVSEIDLERISVPTLAIWGTKDNVSSPGNAKLIKRIKGSRVELLEGARHACYLDKPNEFNSIVTDFLKGIV